MLRRHSMVTATNSIRTAPRPLQHISRRQRCFLGLPWTAVALAPPLSHKRSSSAHPLRGASAGLAVLRRPWRAAPPSAASARRAKGREKARRPAVRGGRRAAPGAPPAPCLMAATAEGPSRRRGLSCERVGWALPRWKAISDQRLWWHGAWEATKTRLSGGCGARSRQGKKLASPCWHPVMASALSPDT